MKKKYANILFIALFSVFMSCISNTPPPNTEQPANPWGMNWVLYAEKGIREIDGRMTAGRISNMVEINGNSILAASPFSGIWFVASSLTTNVSHEWENPGMTCVVKGYGSKYFFAGGYRSDFYDSAALYVTDTSTQTPVFSRWHPVLLAGIGRINNMLYDQNRNMLFLATVNGIWYSPIPPGVGGAGYSFKKAIMSAGSGTSFQNIISTTNNMIVVSQRMYGISGTNSGVYYATYSPAETDISFINSPLYGVNPAQISTVFLAKCSSLSNIVYAFASNNDYIHAEGLYMSTNGGMSFNRATQPDSRVADTTWSQYPFWRQIRDLEFIGTISVHNSNPGIVVISV